MSNPICDICKKEITADQDQRRVATAINRQGDLADLVEVHEWCWRKVFVFGEGKCYRCNEPLTLIKKCYESKTELYLLDNGELHEHDCKEDRVTHYECPKCESKLPIYMDMQAQAVMERNQKKDDSDETN
jgi:hypothetical protein